MCSLINPVNELASHMHRDFSKAMLHDKGGWSTNTSAAALPTHAQGGAFNTPFSSQSQSINTGWSGGNAAHNNMPAYQTLYAWRRTA